MQQQTRLMMVCTANICRSPMAEGWANAKGDMEPNSPSRDDSTVPSNFLGLGEAVERFPASSLPGLSLSLFLSTASRDPCTETCVSTPRS